MDLLTSLETSALGTWVRESGSLWGYPTIITLHTVGLGMLVGANAIVDLRLLGFARDVPLASLTRLFRVMWIAFAINATTGSMLLIADASIKTTQTIFLVKMLFVAAGVAIVWLLKKKVFDDPVGLKTDTIPPQGRLLALASLAVWAVAITAGRLMAYA
jgi:hypothetical protein